MRLLVVSNIAGGGGVTTSFLSLLRMIVNEGHEAIALVPQCFKFRKEVETVADKVLYAKGFEHGGHFHFPFQALQISRAAKEHSIDHIIVNGGRHLWWLKTLQKRPVICIYHGGKPARVMVADRVVAVNDELSSWLTDRGYDTKKVRVIDNVLPIDELPEWQERSFDAPVTLGTLRIFEPSKGTDTFIDAIGLLASEGKKFRVLIAGSGSQEKALKDLVESHGLSSDIIFTGWENHPPNFYRRIDIFVNPTKRDETWGIVIAEAQAHSLPVISTDCTGPKMLIDDGVNGLLVPPDNPVAMAKAIERLTNAPKLAEKIARAGHKSAERYLMKNIQSDYVSFLTAEF